MKISLQLISRAGGCAGDVDVHFPTIGEVANDKMYFDADGNEASYELLLFGGSGIVTVYAIYIQWHVDRARGVLVTDRRKTYAGILEMFGVKM